MRFIVMFVTAVCVLFLSTARLHLNTRGRGGGLGEFSKVIEANCRLRLGFVKLS